MRTSLHFSLLLCARSHWRVPAFLLVGWAFFLSSSASADIRVSPVAVYLSDDDRNARVSIQNSGNQTKEVDVDIEFGYPVSDDVGNVSFRFVAGEDAGRQSAAAWVRIFPRHFVLAPGESQTMIVIAEPPQGLSEGEFWARPVLSFQSNGLGTSGVQDSGAFQLVLSLNYRHGFVQTGVRLHGISVEAGLQKTNVIINLERLGNAAFIGNLVCRLRDRGGLVRTEESKELAVYHSLTENMEFSTSGLEEGAYVAEIELNTDRAGNNPGDILQVPTVSGRTEFSIKKTMALQASPSRVRKEQTGVASGLRKPEPKTDLAAQAKVIQETREKLRAIQADLDQMLNSLNQAADN